MERITLHSNPYNIHPRNTMKWKTYLLECPSWKILKGNVKIDDLVKLEKKMASKEDLKGMDRK